MRRFARAATPEELLVKDGTGRRPRALDAFEPYLRQRWNEGCTNAEQLYQELHERGYRGAPTTVRQYLQSWRSDTIRRPPVPSAPTVRQATGWLLRNPPPSPLTSKDTWTPSPPPARLWPGSTTKSAPSPT
ncbi:hypothetical protein ACIBI9_39910 [Nonomuraea sp. NPDC050451]|uniref:hypothetical protein n=1 Tax=Nonomuraea sp. NPDC050451 TaxID=3364364 RepID=UPI0037AF4ED1